MRYCDDFAQPEGSPLFASRPHVQTVCIREIYRILCRIRYVDIIDLTIPTFYRPAFRILKRYAGKVDAISERTHSNAGDAVRNRDACKIAAIRERKIRNCLCVVFDVVRAREGFARHN